jgi:hypothetical protein
LFTTLYPLYVYIQREHGFIMSGREWIKKNDPFLSFEKDHVLQVVHCVSVYVVHMLMDIALVTSS